MTKGPDRRSGLSSLGIGHSLVIRHGSLIILRSPAGPCPFGEVMQPTFRDLIAENKRNSLLLVILFCLFVTAVAMILSLAVIAYLAPEHLHDINVGEGLL